MADTAKPHYTHIGHTNPWPFTASVGMMVGIFGLLLLVYKNPVSWMLITIGAGVFLIAIFAWVTTMIREDIGEATERTVPEFPSIGKWMVGFLILSEVFLFGALFATYFYLRNHDQIWTQSLTHYYTVDGKEFEIWGLVPILNTIFLVSSSVTVHFAEEAIRHNKIVLYRWLMGITVILGILFVGGQVYEYWNFSVNEHFTPQTSTFGGAFYTLTTLHGFHVFAGVVVLSTLFVGSFVKALSPKRHIALTVASVYWHFVDVIWIILVCVIYLRLI
jgi:cytochrome c oxidase subunit 3